MESSWQSVYIYYQGDGDTLLKGLVMPYMNRLERSLSFSPPFFFVRYFDKGFHIRLRIWLSNTEEKHANQLLQEEVADHNRAEREQVQISYVPYLPEIERYGNHLTIQLAEQQFEQSSRAVLSWLDKPGQVTLSDRYLQALKLHLCFFKALSLPSDQTVEVCRLFIRGWLPRLFNQGEEVLSQIEKWLTHFQSEYLIYKPALERVIPDYWNDLSPIMQPELAGFLRDNQALLPAYQSAGFTEQRINDILGSLMHMTNNRLGISNRDEAFIIYLVQKSLTIISAHDDVN